MASSQSIRTAERTGATQSAGDAETAGNLTDQAYREIEEMIVTLELAPGMALTEQVLIKRLGMSRTPIREALQRLAMEGLVVILPRRGILVSESDIRTQLELLRVRREIERLMARLAAARRPTDRRPEYTAMAENMDKIAAQNDTIGYVRQDKQLATMIAADCQNEFARKTINLLSGLSRRFWYQHYRAADVPRTASLHAELARAIADGNPEEAARVSDELSDYREEFTRATLD